jgi:hypothetical protein
MLLTAFPLSFAVGYVGYPPLPVVSGVVGGCGFEDSSFLGTSEGCSSPETGSLPRSKAGKRKRAPRPPPRRLKSQDNSTSAAAQQQQQQDYGEPHDDLDDDDPHLRHLIAR